MEKAKDVVLEERFISIAILDEEALLAVCAYNRSKPVAAGISKAPKDSNHTSVKERVDHVKMASRVDDLRASKKGSVAGSKASKRLEEEQLWLIPIEDRRRIDSKWGGDDRRLFAWQLFNIGRIHRPSPLKR